MLASTLRRGLFHLGYDVSGRRGRVGRFVIPQAKRKLADSVLATTTLIESHDGCIDDTAASLARRASESSVPIRHLLFDVASDQSGLTPEMTKTMFSAYAEASPHLPHAPKRFLWIIYQRHNIPHEKIEGSFLVHAKEHNGRTWFTATFTDPITNETFSSGLAREVAKTHSRDALKLPAHLADTTILDGKVYYSDLKLAEHAAAARAIDCYMFREQNSITTDLQLCLESPYNTMEEGISQKIDYENIMANKDGISLCAPSTEDAMKHENQPNFLSLADSSSCLFHVPKVMLINAFQMCRIGCTGCFDVQAMTHDGKTWWTASFTDPRTNETFSSGLTQAVQAKRKIGATLNPPLHRASTMIMDGKVYYSNSGKLAEHAAAARALDCYIFREGDTVSSKKWRLCLEDPYSTAEDGVAQKIDYDALLFHKNQKNELSLNDESKITNTIEKGSFSCDQVLSFHLHVPKAFLHRVFLRKYGVGVAYNVKAREHDNQKWYTATATDPITKERFPSGLGNLVRFKSSPSSLLKIPLHLADVKILDGEVYYNERKLAEHAAAARAIDCYIYRMDIADNNQLRLCLEDPYSTEGARQQVNYDALLKKRNELSLDEGEMGEVDLTHLFQRFEALGDEVEVCEFDSGDDDLPVLTISFAEGANKVTKVHNDLSTMGRILEIWTETPGLDSFSEQLYSKSTRHYENESPSAKINSILKWYERIDNEPNNEGEIFALAKLCNKILTALGNANSDLHLEDEERCVNVQKDAKIILDRIISLSATLNDSNEPSILGADTLTAYIRCLNRENPAHSAESAENLLKSMLTNGKLNGVNLPLPNVGTYNAVLGLWALVGGVKGQSCANRVYSLLEAASLGSDDERSLRPNKETFMTLLSVNSKKDGKFSFDQAKSWLCSFQTLVKDADVYAAAIGLNPTDPRYVNSWISSGDQYIGGFKSAGTDSKDEASDVAKWLLYAEECGVYPNAEMYEAIIRAWIKTGTKDGLLIAEDWAKRAVSSSSRIRVETFHPIIAAWALCQFERAPARVKEWINQLTGLSATHPHLKPGLNTLSAQIIAWRNVQAGIISKANETKQSSLGEENANESVDKTKMLRDVEMTFAAAENCMQSLKDLFPQSKLDGVQDTMAMLSMLTHTVKAWGSASQFALLNPTGSASLDTSHGVHEMLNVARLFDAKINGEQTDEGDAHKILHLMGETYAEVISQLHHIDSSSDSDTTTACYFSRELADVEKMLYNYEFYSRSHFPHGSFTPESKALRHRIYKESLRGCAGVKSSADYGHVVRLCRLIMEQLAWLDERCMDIENGNGKEDITDIFVDIALLAGNTVKNPHERTYVLTVMWNNAAHFFEVRKKHECSSYATVDMARLIGAMRMAMKDSELTEPFLRNFDKRPPKRRGRGNTWLALVEELLLQRT